MAQYPYLLPPSPTIGAGSAPAASLLSILAVCGLLVALVGPGLVLLFALRERGKLRGEDQRDVTEADPPESQAAAASNSTAVPAPGGAGSPQSPPAAGLRLRELAIVAWASWPEPRSPDGTTIPAIMKTAGRPARPRQ